MGLKCGLRILFCLGAWGSGASAADVTREEELLPPVPMGTELDWAGPFLEVFVGVGGADSSPIEAALEPDLLGFTEASFDTNGDDTSPVFGLGLGYQHQRGRVVLGIEGDATYGGFEVSSTNPDVVLSGAGPPFLLTGDAIEAGGAELTVESELDWIGTIRPRLGFLAAPDILVSATGGFAFGSGSFTLSETNLFTPGSEGEASETMFGWTVGGSLEYMLTPHLVLRGTYLHIDLGSDEVTVPFGGGSASAEIEFKVDLAKLGLMYKF